MLAQLDDISAFPFKCSYKFIIRDMILYLYILETPWYELFNIGAITTGTQYE